MDSHNPFIGASYLLAGFGLLTKPGIKRYVIIPLLINIFLFIGFFFLLYHYMGVFNVWLSHYLPNWLHWLSYILWLLFFISFLLLFVYTFVIIGNFIAAPFNSLLSEKVELYLTGKTLESRSLVENIKDVPRIIGRQLAILGYYLPRALLCLILFFVPVVQAIAAIIWFVFNAWFMTITYLDYPTDNHRISIDKVKDWLGRKRGIALGFGLSVLVITMIPILNFLIIPAAVAGATKFWLVEWKKK